MKKLYVRLIMSCMLFFVMWVFILALKNNFNMTDVKINLYATLKRLETFNEQGLLNILNNIKSQFSALEFNFTFEYVEVNSISSFFANIGVWFNGIFSIIQNFFSAVGVVLKGVIDFIVFIINLLFSLFDFIFNPVTF